MHVLTLTANEKAPFMTQQIAALEDRGVSFSVRAVPGEVSANRSRRPVDYLKFFPEVIREAGNGYDLVHAHYGLTGPMALAQLRKPVVLSLWGSDLHGPFEPVSRVCARLSDEVVVMSDEMRDLLDASCAVIPDGVDLDQFEPRPRDEARETVGWDEDGYNVLFPYAPTRSVKDYPRAKRIVDAVDHRLDRPVTLQTVYGVDHATVPTYLNAADALILTSKSEGSPNSVKEALACNVPVVATDVGDVRERLAGVDPSTVASTDAELIEGLTRILERGDRSNGRDVARAISIDRTADALLDVYERVA